MEGVFKHKIMNKKIIILVLFAGFSANAQTKTLEDILNEIENANPALKMYDAEVKAMDAAAKGAWSWMPPEAGTGFFMMPYNPKYARKGEMGEEGMGQYVLAVQQMLPNRKRQAAEFRYMNAMSATVKEKKGAALAELIASAKKNYYEWVIIKKKFSILEQNEKLLDFMIKT